MGVVGVEAVEQNLGAVCPVVAVFVHQQHEIGLLREIDALRGELEADRQVEAIGEDLLAVRDAVTIGVLEDEQFVVGLGITRAPVRVARHHRDPEATAVVEGHLHGVGEIGKLLLRSEELELEALHHLQIRDHVAARPVAAAAHRAARFKVGWHRRQRVRAAVVHCEIPLPASGHVVDQLVAQRRHLARLAHLVRIILRPVRLVALAVGVHAVDEVVVVVPEPILLFNRGVHERRICLATGRRGRAVQAVGQQPGELLVTGLGGREAVQGERRTAGRIAAAGWLEEVDERQTVALRHAAHRGSVDGKARVLPPAVGQVSRRAQILEGNRGHEHEARGGPAIVGSAQGVPHEGVELGLKDGGALRAVEGLIEPEEGDHGVGLQVGQPLVGRGEESLAVVGGELGTELLRAGERPLRDARRMGPETRGVPRAAEVAHEQFLLGKAQVQLGLETAVVNVAFGEAVADEGNPLALRGRGDFLRARGGGRRRLVHLRVGTARSANLRGAGRGRGGLAAALRCRRLGGVCGGEAGSERNEGEQEQGKAGHHGTPKQPAGRASGKKRPRRPAPQRWTGRRTRFR